MQEQKKEKVEKKKDQKAAERIEQEKLAMQLKDENRKLRDILVKMQAGLRGTVNGGLDALKNLDLKMDDQLTEAVKKCRITDQIEDKKMEAPPKTQDLDMIEKTYEKNNKKFEWYVNNVINPGRVALLANELNAIDLKQK